MLRAEAQSALDIAVPITDENFRGNSSALPLCELNRLWL
jgi:hypothetical protein